MNLRRLIASIYKEILVLVRDQAGLALLFLMPIMLIFLMTILQDSTYRTIKDNNIPMIFVDNDKDSLGKAIRKGLIESDMFKVVDSINGVPITEDFAENEVARGKYKIAIIVPPLATQSIRNNVNLLINKSFNMGTMSFGKNKQRTSTVEIKIYIDPATSSSFKSSLMGSLKEFTSKLEIKLFFSNLSETLSKMMPNQNKIEFDEFNTIKYTEIYASNRENNILPNSVQHNVPAWTMFAMFFIVLPLAGNMITERKDGSALRLRTMPGSYIIVMISKVTVFLIVAILQFILMLLLGKFVMPLIGLPELTVGTHKLALFSVALFSGLAATGYGVLIGTIATSHEQASTFGSVSIIIMAGLGGIYVPIYIMPPMMKIAGEYSPLYWGLEGFYDIFIRNGGFQDVYPEIIKLGIFFAITISAAFIYNKIKQVT